MADGKTGIELLRRVADNLRVPRNTVLTFERMEQLGGRLLEIADQIECEHAEWLAAAKRDLTDEAREAVESLRAIDADGCKSGTDCWNSLIFALGTDSFNRDDENTTWRSDMALTRDRLCDLIEHGGGQDVDVTALLGLAAKLESVGEDKRKARTQQLCNAMDIGDVFFEPEAIEAAVHAIAERIRKAVDAAPEPDAEREAAADWVEAQGGLDVVKAVSDVLRECVERRDEVLAKLGIEADDEDSESTHDAIMKELDKRLMPCDLTWPCWDDGLPLTRDDAPEHVTAVALCLDGSGYGLLDAILEHAAGERVKRPEPEVLGADGLPIQPDSQERINKDAALPPDDYCAIRGVPVTKGGGYDYTSWTVAMVSDLLRRQRELDAKTMGGGR